MHDWQHVGALFCSSCPVDLSPYDSKVSARAHGSLPAAPCGLGQERCIRVRSPHAQDTATEPVPAISAARLAAALAPDPAVPRALPARASACTTPLRYAAAYHQPLSSLCAELAAAAAACTMHDSQHFMLQESFHPLTFTCALYFSCQVPSDRLCLFRAADCVQGVARPWRQLGWLQLLDFQADCSLCSDDLD